MIVLALDTCFNACSVALGFGGPADKPIAVHERRLMRQGHAEALLPMVERVTGAAGIALSAVELIGVTYGPGTFTGVRTGLAAARALALANAVPVVGFSSLRVIGAAAGGNVVVAADAGRERLFVEVLTPQDADGAGPLLLPVKEAADMISGLGLPVIGSGASVLIAAGYAVRRAAGEDEPDARALLELARDAPLSSKPLKPLYLREPDAKPQDGKAIARRP